MKSTRSPYDPTWTHSVGAANLPCTIERCVYDCERRQKTTILVTGRYAIFDAVYIPTRGGTTSRKDLFCFCYFRGRRFDFRVISKWNWMVWFKINNTRAWRGLCISRRRLDICPDCRTQIYPGPVGIWKTCGWLSQTSNKMKKIWGKQSCKLVINTKSTPLQVYCLIHVHPCTRTCIELISSRASPHEESLRESRIPVHRTGTCTNCLTWSWMISTSSSFKNRPFGINLPRQKPRFQQKPWRWVSYPVLPIIPSTVRIEPYN